jgi:hypothetical protein
LTGRGRNIPCDSSVVYRPRTARSVDKKKGALSHNDIAQQLRLDKLALIDEVKTDIQQQRENLKMLESLLDNESRELPSHFTRHLKYSKGKTASQTLRLIRRGLRKNGRNCYLNAGLVLTLKDERSTSPARAICKSTITRRTSRNTSTCCVVARPAVWWWFRGSRPKEKEERSKVADRLQPRKRFVLTRRATVLCYETARLTMVNRPPLYPWRPLVVRYVRRVDLVCNNIRTKDGDLTQRLKHA